MDRTIYLLNSSLPPLYALVTIHYGIAFFWAQESIVKMCRPLLFVTLVAHSLFFVLRIVIFGRYPFSTLPEIISILSWSTALIYFYVEWHQKNQATGIFILPLVTILQLLASLYLPNQVEPSVFKHVPLPLFALHTLTAVLAYTAFTIGAVYCVMFLLLYRALKTKRFGLIYERLPSLDTLTFMSFGATFVGWLCLTFTIVLGIVMSVRWFPDFYRDPQFFTSLIIWSIYTFAISSYFGWGMRGMRWVFVALSGFSMALLTLLSAKLLWQSFHSFFA